jgi:hypothetical protein
MVRTANHWCDNDVNTNTQSFEFDTKKCGAEDLLFTVAKVKHQKKKKKNTREFQHFFSNNF